MNLKSLLIATLLLAPVLGACDTRTKIPLSVPDHPAILHGTYTGQASQTPNIQTTEPLTLTSTATYTSERVYTITGTLTFRNVTYTLHGEGQTSGDVVLRPHSTPNLVGVHDELFRDGARVGALNFYGRTTPTLHATTSPVPATRQ